ncbi:MAG: Gfo/Idh/MocA family oxidoreductase [Planctomycetota bacterium]
MNDSKCRFGILSAAQIARKNWHAIRSSGCAIVKGVSSRDPARTAAFIEDCQYEAPFQVEPTIYSSHEELLASDEIDAVYIPLPTGLRKEWVIKAAEAKKHVLVEKPVASDASDVEEMIAACESNDVLLMDGVMFDHSQRISAICDQVNAGELGKLRRIQTHFSFCGDTEFQSSNIRTDPVLERHGCLGDLGWYCIRFILWIRDFEVPSRVSGRTVTPIHRESSNAWVPGQFAAEFEFADGVTAGFFCSFMSANQQTALVSGEAGYLSVDDFVLPLYDSQTNWKINRHELSIQGGYWNFKRRSDAFSCDEFHSGEAKSQEVQMIRTFVETASVNYPDRRFAERALKTQQVLDALRVSDDQSGSWIEMR